eukprot:CAMPEP_0201492572 /NCGR_PEP_ID=MMETSP0151_2-20130828/33714_1 /ASSEMBLY_ACC=CAM_ASM_000257 /TAXON_ID=200890 /ORGANISM="Paramoeba atlantica, Strain 621/1 / CCAP 1560/9" /LENGTH=489 /DNA_ID=CAMNT_0047879455 /DNA_START=114 /DNA_END=1583 /DNA_ORIENTATION=+
MADDGADLKEPADRVQSVSPSPHASNSGGGGGGIFGLFGGLFKRGPESPDERSRREEEEYQKEMKRRIRAKSAANKRDKMLRPTERSQTISEKFCTESNEEKQKGKSYSYVVNSLEDLPPDVHGSIERMRVPLEDLKSNFEVFLNVLSFTDKHIPRRRFMTTKQKEKRKKQKSVAIPSLSDRIKLKPEDAYEVTSFTEARKLYKWDTYLGYGGFGQVVEAKSKDRRDPVYNDKVALKFQIHDSGKSQAMNLDEVSVLKFCNHPNVVCLYRALQVRKEIWLVMELLRGGTLKQASTNKGVPFTDTEIAYVASEMLTGIQYLHDNEIAHRDLKNLNIMLTVEGGIKLIDFGLAVDMTLGPRIQMVGSPLWMAPEMIRGEPHDGLVDIWSFTVCMLELANQRPPNASNIKRAMFLSATRGMGDENGFADVSKWPKEFVDFVSKGFTVNPTERPTAATLLKHPFIGTACGMKQIRKKLGAVFVVDALSERGLV